VSVVVPRPVDVRTALRTPRLLRIEVRGLDVASVATYERLTGRLACHQT
jgi:hypothetical protein